MRFFNKQQFLKISRECRRYMSLLQSNSKLVAKLELNPKHRSNVCFSKCGKYEKSFLGISTSKQCHSYIM